MPTFAVIDLSFAGTRCASQACGSPACDETTAGDGQRLLPLLGWTEPCRGAVDDEVVDVAGRATIQAILELPAQEVTMAPPTQNAGPTRHILIRCNFGDFAGIRALSSWVAGVR